MREYRQARLVTTRVERLAEEEEEQLRELDDAVVGSDRNELHELRSESEAGPSPPAVGTDDPSENSR